MIIKRKTRKRKNKRIRRQIAKQRSKQKKERVGVKIKAVIHHKKKILIPKEMI